MAETQNTYQTQFTKDNIVELKNVINKSINAYAEEKGINLDLFLILASLQQSSYELVIRSMPANDGEAKEANDKMKVLADKLIKTIDDHRKQDDSKAVEELLGGIHAISIVNEFYVRRRDEYLSNVQEQAKIINSSEEPVIEQ